MLKDTSVFALKNYQHKLIDQEKGGEKANVNIPMGVFPNNYTYSLWKYNISRLRSFYCSRWCFSTCFCASCSSILDYLSSLILFFYFYFQNPALLFFRIVGYKRGLLMSIYLSTSFTTLPFHFLDVHERGVGSILNSSRNASAYRSSCNFEQGLNGFPALKLPSTNFLPYL
jgi:hypothetical protein